MSLKATNTQNNGKHNSFKTPFGKSKKSLKESLVFIDEIYDLVHKFSEVKEFINQNSRNGNHSIFSWTLPSRGLSFPSFTKVQYPNIAFPLRKAPFTGNVIAYRGYVCKTCLMKYINPIYGFQETGKIAETEHSCHNGAFLGRDIRAGGIIPDFIRDLYQKLVQELRDMVNLWTKNKPLLFSEFVPLRADCVNLKIPKDAENGWVSRTIRYGQTTLSDIELIDFLFSSGNQTYNCFKTQSEQDGSISGPFFMYISKSP